MTIFKSDMSEASVIADIISESNKDVAQAFGINFDNNPKHPSFCNKEWVLNDFERGEEYFTFKDGSVSVGCVAFEQPRPGVAYLNRLSVLPEYRQRGIGEALVNCVFDYAKLKNVQQVSIGIIAEHIKLKAWYLKLGFIEGEIKTFSHLPFNVQYMRFECSNDSA